MAAVVVASAAVVAGAACRGGGGSTGGAAGTHRSAGDQAKVAAVNLKLADLPPEWASSPPADPVGEEGDTSRYAECVGRPDPKTVRTATADSPQFHVEERMRAASTVQAMPTAAAANGDFTAGQGDRGLPCTRQRVQNLLDRQSSAGTAPSSFTIDRMAGASYGDQTVAYRVVFSYPTVRGAAAHKGYLDLVNVRKGRLELSFAFLNDSQPFPADLERNAVRTVVGRA
ncbi:MAG: hypothetical protein ABR511_13190 [Acidimicrobiales bacterium]